METLQNFATAIFYITLFGFAFSYLIVLGLMFGKPIKTFFTTLF